MDALHRSLEAAAGIAAMAVIVDAKDEEAVAFYRRYGFIALQQQPARLFLPMSTLAGLFP
jgi:ribosomal protein S18 acetylase RimI-like enzyme